MSAEVRAVQRSKGSNPTVWLEVTYDGTRPPLALFADLEMIGWRPPVPATPPASALDWSAPDPETGAPCTIRPWTVAGAVVEPPPGSGPRRQWTDAERTVLVATLEGVLRRHGLLDPSEPLPAPDGDRPDLAHRPSAPPANEPRPDRSSAGPSPAASTAAEIDTSDRPTTSVVRAPIVPSSLRDQVSSAIAPLGVASHIGMATRTITSSYRASTYQVEVQVLEIEVLCDPALVEVVSAVLRDLGLDPTVVDTPDAEGGGTTHRSTISSARRGREGSAEDRVDPAAEIGSGPTTGTALVAVVVDPTKEDRALAVLARHAVGPVRTEPAVVRTVGTYRGTTFASESAALRIVCPVAAAQADDVAAHAADLLGIRPGDAERLQVVHASIDLDEPPEPTTPAAIRDAEPMVER